MFAAATALSVSADAARAADAVEPILLHHAAASPAVWCDNSTIVYAVKPDTEKSQLRSIVTQTIPGGEPRELFRDSGSAVPYQCVNGRILYWTLDPTDCGAGPEETRHQAVYVADMNGTRAPLACGAAVALLSPDARLLAVSTNPAFVKDWLLVPEGIRLLAGSGKAPLIVGLRKPDLFDALIADGRVMTTDFIIGRFEPSIVQKEYALGSGAIRWLTNQTLAVSLVNLDTGEMLLRTIRLDPEAVEIVWTNRVSLGAKGFLVFDSAGPERVYAWSTTDDLRQVQECWLSEWKMSCTTLALHHLLNKVHAGMAANFDSDVDFRDDYTIRFLADVGNSECLMQLNLVARSSKCLIDHTEKLVVPYHGQFKRLAISPDRKWAAYIVLKNLGWNGSSDLMLLSLPD